MEDLSHPVLRYYGVVTTAESVLSTLCLQKSSSHQKLTICKPHQTELANLDSRSPAICKHWNLLMVCLLAISMHFLETGKHQVTRYGHKYENTAHRTWNNRAPDTQDLIKNIWLHWDTWKVLANVFNQDRENQQQKQPLSCTDHGCNKALPPYLQFSLIWLDGNIARLKFLGRWLYCRGPVLSHNSFPCFTTR